MRLQKVLLFVISAIGATGGAAASLPDADAVSAASYDYVINGDFETGTSSWSGSNASDLSAIGSSEIPVAQGGASGKLTLGDRSARIQQTTREGVGAGAYRFRASIRLAQATTIVRVQIDPGGFGASTPLDVPAAANSWLTVDRVIDVPSTAALTIAIIATGSVGDVVYVDDVHFEGPAPMTMTPTASPEPAATGTAAPDATGTRTPTATKTARPTAEPTSTSIPDDPIGPSLRNAGFETASDDGTPLDWHKFGGTLAVDPGRAHTGGAAARLTSTTDSTKWLYQTVTVDPGGTYAFDAWVLDDDANVASAFLRISWYATADGSGSALGTADSTETIITPEPGYRLLSTGAVSAPEGTYSARLRIVLAPASGGEASIYADDAAFGAADPATAITEPTPATDAAAATDDGGAPVDARQPSASAARRSVAGASAAPSASIASDPSRTLVINEVMYDPQTDQDAEGEWVEIYNASDSPISLRGWSLADAGSTESLPDTRVEAHSFVVVAASDSFSEAYPAFDGSLLVLRARIGNALGNEGDRLVLRDASGAVVDAVSWGADTGVLNPSVEDVPEGHSIERRTAGADSDTAADFVDNERPSPGSAIGALAAPGAAPPLPQRSVELLAGHGGPSLDWLLWPIVGLSAVAAAASAAWRLTPMLVQRRRHQS